MTGIARLFAPCKLNLHLRVLGKRPDGFHGIESVFQLISLSDELEIELGGPDSSCAIECVGMDLPNENTIAAAVERMRSLTGITSGIRVRVVKNVPSGAGLGGGSSDAAATLVALDRLWGANLSKDSLLAAAASIGSDVPFFLFGGAAIVTGRGEKIVPIQARSDLFGVLIWPGVASPTGAAYGLVDKARLRGFEREIDWPCVDDLAEMYRSPVSEWKFRNSFTAPVETVLPSIREARLALRDSGAVYAEMSGSGSSVFGLFETESAAKIAQKALSSRWERCVQFLLLASSQMQ